MSAPRYEVYAVKYAHHERRTSENFIGGDPYDWPTPLDCFVWLVRGAGREIVDDTGFSAAVAAKRQREHLRCPAEGLRLLGCDARVGRFARAHHSGSRSAGAGALPRAVEGTRRHRGQAGLTAPK